MFPKSEPLRPTSEVVPPSEANEETDQDQHEVLFTQLEAESVDERLQALQMLLKLENAAGIKAYALEHPVAVQQAVIEDRYLGVLFVDEFAVQVNLHAIKSLTLIKKVSLWGISG